MTQLYEARLIVEPEAAALAAARATDPHVLELRRLVERMDSIAAGTGDLPEFLRTDRAFHDVIARAGRNVAIRAMMRDLHRYMSFNWAGSRIHAAELPVLAEQHRRIAGPIADRDPGAARQAMREHVSWARRVETDRAT
jgi:DNA-binding FadR family transcriptional regulator